MKNYLSTEPPSNSVNGCITNPIIARGGSTGMQYVVRGLDFRVSSPSTERVNWIPSTPLAVGTPETALPGSVADRSRSVRILQ